MNNVPFTYDFIATKWIVKKGAPKMTDEYIASDNVEKIRQALLLRGLCRLGRDPFDDKEIIESWI